MEEINFRQLCKNLKKRGYEPAEKGVSDFVEEYEKIVFSVEPKNMRLKDIVNKMKDLSDHTRAVWIDGILREFGNGFGSEKWREGYEQGKFEGALETDKKQTVVPQFVADWYEENKDDFEGNLFRCAHNIPSTFDGAKLNEFERWFLNASIKAFQILVNMHQFGYTVEKEKRYLVKMKGMQKDCVALKKNKDGGYWYLSDTYPYGSTINIHTRKELEDAGFGWVFDCEGMEVEEVKG